MKFLDLLLATVLLLFISLSIQAQSESLGFHGTGTDEWTIGLSIPCSGCLPSGYSMISPTVLPNTFSGVTTTQNPLGSLWATPIPASPNFGHTTFAAVPLNTSDSREIRTIVHGLEIGETYTIAYNYMFKGGVCSNSHQYYVGVSATDIGAILDNHVLNGAVADVWYTQYTTFTAGGYFAWLTIRTPSNSSSGCSYWILDLGSITKGAPDACSAAGVAPILIQN